MTEAGTRESGIVKSSIGIGALLLKGIGDTIRVSLTDDPVEEIYAAKRILRACGLEKDFVDVISCPTCGRCEWKSMELAQKVERMTFRSKKRCKIAVMGCVCKWPGRAKECDLGIAGGQGEVRYLPPRRTERNGFGFARGRSVSAGGRRIAE